MSERESLTILLLIISDPAIGNFSEEIAHVGKPQDSNSIEYPLRDEVSPYKKTDRNRILQSNSK